MPSKAIKEDRYGQIRKGRGKKASPAKIKRPTEATYVYKAVVDRVIDGDTLILQIDLGFEVWKEQRVRLAEIDTPAVDKQGGKEAYRFVLNEMAKTDFVTVKTIKTDIYGRYVGHIFYSLKPMGKSSMFLKGTYLNQELLDRGLAKMI